MPMPTQAYALCPREHLMLLRKAIDFGFLIVRLLDFRLNRHERDAGIVPGKILFRCPWKSPVRDSPSGL